MGDVVVFQNASWDEHISENHFYVKRIVALPGDTVEIRDDRTLVNGHEIFEEGYIQVKDEVERRSAKYFGPLKLERDSYFVLGDNRSNTLDSRVFGPVRLEHIRGKVRYILWSFSRDEGTIFFKAVR